MPYPDYITCLRLLKEAGCNARTIEHTKTVHRFSMVVAKKMIEQGQDINLSLVEAGALLHDIGRSRANGISHAVEGAKIAGELGLPGELVAIIRNHIGAGLTREEALACGLPPTDYLPRTTEQMVVAHADNLTRGSRFQTIGELVDDFNHKGLKAGAERAQALHKKLSRLCGVDLDELLRGV